MRKSLYVALTGLALLAVWQVSGCSNIIPPQTIDFELGEGLGVFDVEAGVPKVNHGTASALDTGGVTVAGGSVRLNPEAITVTPAGGGPAKGAENLQTGEPLVVTAWIASVDEVETVCETGEQYGPYEVTLDENYVPVSISPSSITFSQNTVDLLNGGTFSLCIEVVSPVTGTVTIDALTLNLNLTL